MNKIEYRIKELVYENGKSEFLPQYKEENRVSYDENGKLKEWDDFTHWLHDKYLMIRKCETYDEALSIIYKDEMSKLKPIDEKIHEIK